ncbi:hypothetical protein D5S17_06100 [Pseudonocardiaceae bacterium YIM PH 21723]|nr:hypothetical protein D5S17_06100 [Pseudonocardiaceae bacterium YIM PH 21723]
MRLIALLTGFLLIFTGSAAAATRELRLDVRSSTLPAAPEVGTQFVSTGALFDGSGGQVGEQNANCSVVQRDPLLAQCAGVLRLSDGDIHYSAVIPYLGRSAQSCRIAVLAGTGAYAGLRGVGKLLAQRPGQSYSVILDLKP